MRPRPASTRARTSGVKRTPPMDLANPCPSHADAGPPALGSVTVITGAHAIIFTRDADAVRAFLRDVLGVSSVDAGGGWPIFGPLPAQVAVHPTDDETHDELYLIADDLYATVAELNDKGVKFTRPIEDAAWGLVTALELPDGRELALYEPRHPRPLGSDR